MGSADFSQFVVTTANETACETSTLKVRALSPHLPATFTGTSSNFWTSSLLADLSAFPSLICGSCSSGQRFAYSFLQIPPRDGHPCCSAIHFPLSGHVRDLHPLERAHGAQTNKSRRIIWSLLLFVVSYEAINGKRTERQKIEELNRYSFREASQALSSLGSSLAEYMAGHITLTKTKDGYVTYDELLAELRKMFGVRK